MSQSSDSNLSSSVLRIQELEKKVDEQSKMLTQMMDMLKIITQANSPVSPVKTDEEDTNISSPVKPVEKKPKATKKQVDRVVRTETTKPKAIQIIPDNNDYSAYGRLCNFYENK
jgi:hypothetical protein